MMSLERAVAIVLHDLDDQADQADQAASGVAIKDSRWQRLGNDLERLYSLTTATE